MSEEQRVPTHEQAVAEAVAIARRILKEREDAIARSLKGPNDSVSREAASKQSCSTVDGDCTRPKTSPLKQAKLDAQRVDAIAKRSPQQGPLTSPRNDLPSVSLSPQQRNKPAESKKSNVLDAVPSTASPEQANRQPAEGNVREHKLSPLQQAKLDAKAKEEAFMKRAMQSSKASPLKQAKLDAQQRVTIAKRSPQQAPLTPPRNDPPSVSLASPGAARQGDSKHSNIVDTVRAKPSGGSSGQEAALLARLASTQSSARATAASTGRSMAADNVKSPQRVSPPAFDPSQFKAQKESKGARTAGGTASSPSVVGAQSPAKATPSEFDLSKFSKPKEPKSDRSGAARDAALKRQLEMEKRALEEKEALRVQRAARRAANRH